MHGFDGFMRRVARRILAPPKPSSPRPATNVPEITPSTARACHQEGPRLNMLLPSINAQHYFGGIHTAVQFYRALCPHFPESRIVLTDASPDEPALQRFSDHELVDSHAQSPAPRQIVPYNDRYQRPLAVGRGDVFVATAWWTAFAAQSLARFQEGTFGAPDRIAYLIQDFEPGFYPWSSRYALALSTYRPGRDFGVINTSLLAHYMAGQGICYEQARVFEPAINSNLVPALDGAQSNASEPRQRRIIVYARPSTPRNAFELICEALTHWSVTYPEADRWEVLALGEIAEDTPIGAAVLRGMGKLGLAEYGRLLSESAVGFSLMVSPHPSYPPLEMGAFGIRTVVNDFGGKNLGALGDAFYSVAHPTPEALSHALARACTAAEAASMRPTRVGVSAPPGYLEGREEDALTGIAADVARFFGGGAPA